ncbi:MAG: hypothetical protein V1854_02895 [Methanobacteriota archaeon]
MHFIRRVDNDGQINVLNETFSVGKEFTSEYIWATICLRTHLWDQEWKGLSSIFPSPEETSNTRQKEISTADIAKLLTFYRCLDPGSYLSAVEWFETTTSNLLLDMDPLHINESRLLNIWCFTDRGFGLNLEKMGYKNSILQ